MNYVLCPLWNIPTCSAISQWSFKVTQQRWDRRTSIENNECLHYVPAIFEKKQAKSRILMSFFIFNQQCKPLLIVHVLATPVQLLCGKIKTDQTSKWVGKESDLSDFEWNMVVVLDGVLLTVHCWSTRIFDSETTNSRIYKERAKSLAVVRGQRSEWTGWLRTDRQTTPKVPYYVFWTHNICSGSVLKVGGAFTALLFFSSLYTKRPVFSTKLHWTIWELTSSEPIRETPQPPGPRALLVQQSLPWSCSAAL